MRKIIDWLFRPEPVFIPAPSFVDSINKPEKTRVSFYYNESKKTAAEHCGNWTPHRAHDWRNAICPDWTLKCGGELD